MFAAKMLADLKAPFSAVEGHHTTHRNVLDQTLLLDVTMLPLSVSLPDAVEATWKHPGPCLPPSIIKITVVDPNGLKCPVADLRGILGPTSWPTIIRKVFSPKTDVAPGSRMMPSSTWL